MLLDKGGFQLKKLINPCLIAVIAGMVFFIFQIRLPESIDFAMGAIVDMNTPLAMLLSGAIMTQLNFKEVLTKRRLFFVAILRLIVSAGLFCLLLRFLPIDDQMRTVADMDDLVAGTQLRNHIETLDRGTKDGVTGIYREFMRHFWGLHLDLWRIAITPWRHPC